jgi:hypothetical protein
MDPVSVLGLAANILQFVHFGLVILSKSKELSRKGTTKENFQIEAIVTHLKETLDRLDAFSPPSSSSATTLRSQSTSIINELLKALEDLKVSGIPTASKSFRKALKAARSKEKIQDWIRRLNNIREEYNLQLEVEIL